MMRSKSDIIFLLVLLGASLGANLWLFSKYRRTAEPAEPAVPISIVGRAVPSLDVHSLTGEPVTLSLKETDRPTIIYVLRPTCVWCMRNTNNIQHLVAAAKDRYRFVGISLEKDGLQAYLEKWPLPFPVYVAPSAATVKALNAFYVTPQTFVVNARGVIDKVWDGAYAGHIGPDIQDFFGISLPGITGRTPDAAFSGCRDEFGGEYSANTIQRFKDGLKRCGPDGKWGPVVVGRSLSQGGVNP